MFEVPSIEIFNQDHIPLLQYGKKLVDFNWVDVPITKDFDYWRKNLDLLINKTINELD